MKLEFHKGMDYAVIMTPKQTTDAPLAHLYGQDREVTKFGNLFAASGNLLAAAEKVLANLNQRIDAAPPDAVPVFDGIADLHDAINKARGRC